MRKTFRGAIALLGLLLLPRVEGTHAASIQDRLIELDQIAISHDLCGFALSDGQQQALTSESETIADELKMQPEDAQRLYDQFAESMRRQKETGLCDPKGEWAAAYLRLAAALGP